MKILMGGGLSPSVEQAATRLRPPMDTIHAHHDLLWMRFRVGITFFIRKVVIPRKIRHQTIGIRRRSNARAHSPSRRLVFQRATARKPTPLDHMNQSAHERYNSTTSLRTHCLGNPTGN